MNQSMRAVVQRVFGPPEVLEFAELARPAPAAGDLLVRVRAAAVNPVDAKQRVAGKAGEPVPNAPRILGWDGAGVVEAMGAEVDGFAVGDEVYFAGDIGRPGSYAQYVAVDARIAARKPKSLGFESAAAIPLTALTAWEGIVETLRVEPGQGRGRTLLIVGGAGGVGSIAIQIAKKVCALRVVATASRPESRARCLELGADEVIDHSVDLAAQLKEKGIAGAQLILSTATLANFPQLVDALAPLGHICALQSGPAAQAVNVSLMMPKRGTLSYELMFTRPRTGVEPERQGQILARVAELIDQSELRPTLSDVMPWQEVREAHRRIETTHTIGKIVLRVD